MNIRGVLLSLILHIFIILFVIYIIPEFFSKTKKDVEIAVDIISLEEFVAEVDIYQSIDQIDPEKKQVEPKPDDDKIREIKKLQPEELPQLSPTQKPKQETSKKKKGKKAKIAPDAPITEGEIGLEGSDDQGQADGDEELESILREIKRVQEEEIEENYRKRYIYGEGLDPYEKKNIRTQVNACWNNIVKRLFNRDEIQGIKIRVLVAFDREGNVLEARLTGATQQYMALDNSLYRQVADSALATFYRCKKIFNLPKDKYEHWKEFEFTFDPSDIID